MSRERAPRDGDPVWPGAMIRTAMIRAAMIRAALLALLAMLLASGCVMVRPEEREYLADPAMTFGSGGTAEAQEEHVLSNREGSSGGGQASGGGCGCN